MSHSSDPAPSCSHAETTNKQTEHNEALAESRRAFLKEALGTGGAAISLSALAGHAAAADPPKAKESAAPKYHYVPATDKTVHWGYFSKSLKPLVEVDSGDYVTIETLTHHANDDAERMIQGDPGAESVYFWDKNAQGRGPPRCRPLKPTLFGRGSGEGLGVHICTGPIYVKDAEPGDILEVRILDVEAAAVRQPQLCRPLLRQ